MPMLVLRRFSKVRSSNPAPVSRASESAISPATRVLRIQLPRRDVPDCSDPLDLSASPEFIEEDCNAGASPNKTPAARQVRKVKKRGTNPTPKGLGWKNMGQFA